MQIELPAHESILDTDGLRLRAVDAPLAGTTHTWAMDLRQEDLPIPKSGSPCKVLGFWNDIPSEEQREVVELMPPSYGRKELRPTSATQVLDVREMAFVVIGLYLSLALLRLVILIARI